MMQFWVSPGKAKSYGCTHKARFLGIIPGFFSEAEGLWVSRSDLMIPLELILSFIWVSIRQMRGEEPDFMFEVGKPI